MKIKIDQLIAVLGKEKADSFFLNPDWIKRQRKYYIKDLKYKIWEQFGRLEDLGGGVYHGNINFETCLSPDILSQLPKIKELKGDFDCGSNNLTSLEGSPKLVTGDFRCDHNKLIDLEGSPEFVGGDFDCAFNELTSLKGSPKIVEGSFDCIANYDLDNLDGISEEIKEYLICYNTGIERNGMSEERTPDGKTYRLRDTK